MTEQETILEADGVRVVFFRRGDRYAHRLEVLSSDRGEWTIDCESLEGEPGDEWPPSPPFQQLHVEHRTTGPVVLLIGMAGRSHWSAAVEAAEDRKSIVFETAVRVQDPPERMGSEYTVVQESVAGAVVETSVPILEILSAESGTDHCIRAAVPTSFPATVTWKYAFRARIGSP